MQLFIADVIVFVYMNHVGNVGKDITYSGNKSKPYYDALQWPVIKLPQDRSCQPG